ncbi:hypothetical protein JMJ56_00750 [Belnapia sp. T18]|uniref:Uncharacterized protein n=1 Tax=Belnapia arida TaxID=2804533 RepID=A0ABS1TXC4_9PROT|nr:hypothetical protein [Belnapia arida]MBL6076510.1 hypothetical protein [Belnapia arida]
MPDRRSILLLPLLAAACGGRLEPVPLPSGPLGYKYLSPLPLNVAGIDIAEEAPSPVPGDIGARLSPSAPEAVRIMARDRLIAVGTTGQARFTVSQAQVIQSQDALTSLLGCRLEILSGLGSRVGFAEAAVTRSVSGPEAKRPNAPEALLRRAMDDLNVEFEFQLRRALKDWLSQTTPDPDGGMAAPGPGQVGVEDLSPGAAAPRGERLP